MKTLDELFQKIIHDIFPSFSSEHQQALKRMYKDTVLEWLLGYRLEEDNQWVKSPKTPEGNQQLVMKNYNDTLDELMNEIQGRQQ